MPLEPCEKRAARVSSTALVRYRGNDYSTPTSYGFQEVLVKGFVEEVVILCRGTEIARHARSYGQGVFVYDPLHYLALIETKPNALDQAAALQGWDLPEGFQHLAPSSRSPHGQSRQARVHPGAALDGGGARRRSSPSAVNDAIRLGAIGFDAVKQIVLARIEKRPRASRSGGLSLSAADERQDNVGRRLRRALVRERRMSAAKKDDKPAAAQTMPSGTTSGTPQLLLAHHLKQLKLPTILREYDKVAREAAREGIDHTALSACDWSNWNSSIGSGGLSNGAFARRAFQR